MPGKNLELPSVDEIDFELKETQEKKESKVDAKSLQKEIVETQGIFSKLKDNLDKLKEEEFQIELKKENFLSGKNGFFWVDRNRSNFSIIRISQIDQPLFIAICASNN